MSTTMIVIKTVCVEEGEHFNEVRRVSLEQAKLKVNRLERLVRRQFPGLLEASQSPLLQYHDDEDDKITVRVNAELDEAVRVAQRLNKVLKLLVSVDRQPAKPSAPAAAAAAEQQESKADADDDWRAKAKQVVLEEFTATFVGDKTLADGSTVEAGAELKKTWTVKNGGEAAWPEGMALVCVGGNMKPKAKRVALPAVVPGAQVDVSVALTAPAQAGQRGKSVWRFQGREGETPASAPTLWAYVVVDKGAANGAANGGTNANAAAGGQAKWAGQAWQAKKQAWQAWQAKKQAWAKKQAEQQAERLAQLQQEDFKLTNLQELALIEPGYRFGARCDDTNRRLGTATDASFWHANVGGVGVDLSQSAFGARFGAAPKAAATNKKMSFKVSFVADKTLADGTEVAVGEMVTKTWTVRNNGTEPWPAGVVLVCVKSDNMEAKEQRVAMPLAAPGATADVSVTLCLREAGRAKSVWHFADGDGKRIGSTRLWAFAVGVSAPVAEEESKSDPSTSTAPKATFVGDKTLADGSTVEAGAELTKTWTVKNGGEAAWPATDLVCVGGNMAAEGTRVPVPAAAAGAVVDVSVQLKAPEAPGRVKSVWRFEEAADEHRQHRPFDGDKLWADVKVVPAVPAEAVAEPEDRSANAASSRFIQQMDLAANGIATAAQAAAAATPAKAEAAGPSFKVSFVADKTIADGSAVGAGEAFTKTWTIRNDGDTPWPHGGAMLVCVKGNMEAKEWKVLPTVAPGAEIDVSVELTAPSDGGRGKSVWAFQNAAGKRLSEVTLWVDVVAEAEPEAKDAEPEAEAAAAEAEAEGELEAEEGVMVAEVVPESATAAADSGKNVDNKDAPSWASYAASALAGGVVGVAHMMSRGSAADGAAVVVEEAPEEDEAEEAEGFKTAEDAEDDERNDEDAAAVVVVPADTEAAVTMVELEVEVGGDEVIVLADAAEAAPVEVAPGEVVVVPAPAQEPTVAAAAPPTPPGPWEAQLTQVAEMGFVMDRTVLTTLLEEHHGNVHRVVLQLLQQLQQ